ncbi:MAG: PhnD/SsuA/transferrin family substrate-binding protein [Bacteroides sp.]|nr:PhnD/SsuA/transferrin family substrate-binding protein [Eubacterium sp.]MCM1417361.1 PhnD/SsuA/transferrin family substrate-binding protein [Roseburia sp.]MCM1461447.1 PhnD/SsuA/transferrin family substrate-binding protein [Bacteroides sp.]
MKKKRTLAALMSAAMCLLFAGCNGGAAETTTPAETTAPAPAETTETTEATQTDESEAPSQNEETDAPQSEDTLDAPERVKVAALKGPTAMGLTYFMDHAEETGVNYDFTIAAAVDEISPMLIQGTTDLACVPANLASVLYNKTEGAVEVLAVNTLGVLYIAENGDEVASIADLKGKTIYSSGKGATPEFSLNYLLSENGIDPTADVTIEWKSEHSECLADLVANPGSVAMLPQPFITTALTKNEDIRVAVDLNEEWDKLDNGSALLTGVIVGRKEFIESYPDVIDGFLDGYAESVDYVNTNVPEAAQLIEKYDIVPAAVAEKALPACNIVCITGAEMKEKLSGYLGVLFDQLPSSVGGALPSDDFYYVK